MTNAYSASNAEWRKNLSELVRRLKKADCARPAGTAGWTVGGLLGHLAFWDRRAVLLLEKWKKDDIGPSPMDTDLVNEAMRPFLNALPAGEAAKLALDAAAAIDALIDSLDLSFLARVESEGKPVRLNRSLHRVHHIAQIEGALR